MKKWRKVFANSINKIVVIKFCHTMPFDGEDAGASEATGFVVDAERGYILTNRHVAGPGPFWGSCIFQGNQEAMCSPLYIDPVHDFAFLQYDVSAIQNRGELCLSNCSAIAGQSILVIGNDAAQELSIIPGIISLIHRNAPEYVGPYRDFNINYYQGHMNLSGGISGSPVIAADGSVLGMVSGSMSRGSICYILPAYHMRKSLRLLWQYLTIPRGDIQCRFTMTPLHECNLLGLDHEWETHLRKYEKESRGLLVVRAVLDSGPAAGKIAVGDVLVSVNNRYVTDFDRLGDLFDDNVGREIIVRVLRNSQLVAVAVDVQDLNEVTPDKILSVDGLFCHAISYIQATRHDVSLVGVYVTQSDGSTIIGDGGFGWIISAVDDQTIKGLSDLLHILVSLRKGSKIAVTCAHVFNIHRRINCVISIDAPRGITMLSRHPSTRTWESTTIQLRSPRDEKQIAPEHRDNDSSWLLWMRLELRRWLAAAKMLWPRAGFEQTRSNLIFVETRAYLYLNGVDLTIRQGIGIILDDGRGLVAVSQDVMPHRACSITLYIDTVQVKGRCLYIHPHYYYAVLQYEVSAAPRHEGNAILSSRRLVQGDKVKFLYFSEANDILRGKGLLVDASTTFSPLIEESVFPNCAPINADLIGINAAQDNAGVLLDANGAVLALWVPSFGGIAAHRISSAISCIQKGTSPTTHVFPAEMEEITPELAMVTGVPRSASQTSENPNELLQTYKVKNVLQDTERTTNSLSSGDVVLGVNGSSRVGWKDFEVVDSCVMLVQVWRKGSLTTVEFSTMDVGQLEVRRSVEFCGASIQPPHLQIYHELDNVPSEVFISRIAPGSPAERFGLLCESFITCLDGKTVTTLEDFIQRIRAIPGDRELTVSLTTMSGKVAKFGLRQNIGHFPLLEWEF